MYLTAEAAPLAYAATQNNLGLTYEVLEEWEKAIVCWEESQRYYAQMGYDYAGYFAVKIAAARARLGA